MTLGSAALVGLLGGVHCAGMCGGIVGALTLGLPEQLRGQPLAMAPYVAAYNLGRILSYATAGALMGGLGRFAAHLVAVNQAQQGLRLLAGLFMLMLGLYLGGWWTGLARLERAGGVLWRRIEPLGRRLLPVRTPPQALLVGLLWGWLPCGLVYTALTWSLSAGSAGQGALLMLGFGLGTLPAVAGMGAFAVAMTGLLRRPWVRGGAGVLVLAFGAYTVALALLG